jgi:uncharacterized protein YqhQ
VLSVGLNGANAESMNPVVVLGIVTEILVVLSVLLVPVSVADLLHATPTIVITIKTIEARFKLLLKIYLLNKIGFAILKSKSGSNKISKYCNAVKNKFEIEKATGCTL